MKIFTFIAMVKNRARRKFLYVTPEYWDSKAIELEGDAVSMWPNNHLNRLYHAEQMAQMAAFLPDPVGLAVLDAGCGTGRLSRLLASRGAHVTGIDFSAKAIELAKASSSGFNPDFQHRSLGDIYEEGAYDLILTWGVLTIAASNRDDLVVIMRTFRRAIKPGGLVFILEPVHRGFVHRVLNMHLNEFLEVLKEAGFEISSVRQMHFWPMRFALAFLPWPAWFTNVFYNVGQVLMSLPILNRMGDYKAIKATARP